MRLRSQTHAALRALLDLALHGAVQAPVPVSDIAKRQGLGVAFLEQLFRPLKKAGLVAPWRGMKGGYTLVKAPEAVSLLAVLVALDDPVVRSVALGSAAPSAEAEAVSVLLASVEEGLGRLLNGISLADLKTTARANPLLKDAPRVGAGFHI